MADGFVKSFVCKARKLGKGEAYFSYVEPFSGEAQRSRRTFYEVVKNGSDKTRQLSYIADIFEVEHL